MGDPAGCLPALPPPESDSRTGRLQGAHGRRVPELTAGGPLKIVLSGAVRLCLLPRAETADGESAMAVKWCPLPGPSFYCLHPQVPGAFWSRIQKTALEGLLLKEADTVQIAGREGAGERESPTGLCPLGQPPQSPGATTSSSSTQNQEPPLWRPDQPVDGAHPPGVVGTQS